MSTHHTYTNDKLQIIKKQTKTSPDIKTTIDPITILESLDQKIDLLKKNPSPNVIQDIRSELSSMEIVTVNIDNTAAWLIAPITMHKQLLKRPIIQRITHLFKTRGVWQSKSVRRETLDVAPYVQLPLHVVIKPTAKADMKKGKIDKLLLSIAGLRFTISTMLKDGVPSSGIFRKADGVIHMNKTSMWVTENETVGSFEMKNDFRTVNLIDTLDNAVFTTEN